ncbi:hypothetical protein FB381_3043 [Nocardioides albertanoniae]|uniref:Uncharacterized protein n=1 Tax=Nocardioides albertanoniae TaxID=1175486 RepID=A0A543A985_9ACTN|nr:hypothetical protein [Nocardioides albertanoniae]TQL69141.1 hypothetical protein FB381_3043 [Nocardioides albertanoniae]
MISAPVLSETSVEGLHEPVSPTLERRLRRAVLDHTATEHRRSFLPLVHLGDPGGKEVAHAHRDDEPTDQWLRTDIIHSMRRRAGVPDPIVWLTRGGDLEIEDVDLRWLAAARQAFGEIGAPLTFVVVIRNAWLDPRSGAWRRWKRLRYRNA